ncbi:hypothetical protein HYFRA_00013089 [Hymenoscyphus fraxineus]|uniref:Zn(2)-C6 fungal-type domain-containing protein n=1 Tax=Hymenoscyphus fraxineus TaxID=746836 RepID=A0A9N9L585_9HELO|nr:hypothetical protein HYFRA_00013089 [Hymenoscyphus fraxineus]
MQLTISQRGGSAAGGKGQRRSTPRTLPSCNRCLLGGKKCEYTAPTKKTKPKPSAPRKIKKVPGEIVFSVSDNDTLIPQSSPELSSPIVRQNTLHFQYFREIVAESLSWSIDSEFWKRAVLQLSDSEEFIQQAVVGLARLHRCQALPTSERAKEQQQASTHYMASLRLLNKRLDNSSTGRELALYGCILFITHETLCGYNLRAMRHLHGGLAILNEVLSKSWVSTPFVGLESVIDTRKKFPESLREIVSQLSRINVIASTYPSYSFNANIIRRPEVPEEICTSAQAYDTLCDIITSVQYLRNLGSEHHCQYIYTTMPPNMPFEVKQLEIIMEQWIKAYKAFEAGPELPDYSSKTIPARTIMTQYLAARIELSMIIYTEELSYDDFTEMYTEINERAANIIASPNYLRSVGSFGIIQPLWLVANKCRDWKTRKRSIDLLNQSGGQGLWTGRALAVGGLCIAEKEHFDKDGNFHEFVPEERRLRRLEIATATSKKSVSVIGARRDVDGNFTYITDVVSCDSGSVSVGNNDMEYFTARWKAYMMKIPTTIAREDKISNN